MDNFDFNDLKVVQYKNQLNHRAYKIEYAGLSAGKILMKLEEAEGIKGWFISIELNKQSRNKGIGIFALIKILYKNLGIDLYANVRNNNIASKKILEKSGFEVFGKTKSGQLIYQFNHNKFELSPINQIDWERFKLSVLVDIFVFLGVPQKRAMRVPYKNEEKNYKEYFISFCEINGFYYKFDDCYLIISKDNNVEEIYLTDICIEKHIKKFGELLGYPHCCIDYIDTFEEDAIDELEKKIVTERNYSGIYQLIDFKDYYLGRALISHIPCSANCNESLKYALLTLLFIKNNSEKVSFNKISNLTYTIDNLSSLNVK